MERIEQKETQLNNPFLALRHRNFALYMSGMAVSLIGTWMQNVAQPWLAYSLTKSPLLLSLVGILQFLPVMLFSLFAGVVVDRIPKKTLLLITQSASLAVTLALSLLVLSGRVQFWHILVAASALGVVNTLDMPARQSFVVEMVGRKDLTNAIALNSSLFNIARVVGPAVAGLVMGVWGVAACFLINSLSFAAVLISLLFIHPTETAIVAKEEHILRSIGDGLRYIMGNRTLRLTILATLIVGTFGMNSNVLVPVFAKVVLGQGEAGFGLLMSFLGVGSFAGAMVVATMSRRGPSRSILKLVPFLLSVSLAFVAAMKAYSLAAFGLAAVGFCFVTFASTANSTLQLTVSDEYRGRVMSVYSLVLGGSTPIGNLFSGYLSEHFGAPAGFLGCGIATVVLFAALLVFANRTSKQSMGVN